VHDLVGRCIRLLRVLHISLPLLLNRVRPLSMSLAVYLFLSALFNAPLSYPGPCSISGHWDPGKEGKIKFSFLSLTMVGDLGALLNGLTYVVWVARKIETSLTYIL